MPDNDSNSTSPVLAPLSQPNSPGSGTNLPRLGTFCETPNGALIELPQLGKHFDKLVTDFCHKAALDYLMNRRFDIAFPVPPYVMSDALVKQVDLEKFPAYDGTMFKTPALQLGKFDAAAIFSVKPAMPLGASTVTGAGVSLGYHLSPRFRISASGTFGERSTNSYGQPITPQQDFGVTILIKKTF